MQEALDSVERIERESSERQSESSSDAQEVKVEVESGDVPKPDQPEEAQAASDGEAESAPSPDEQIGALKDQLLRLAADFENFRKRARREQEDLRKYGVDQTARALLPVVDNLERALKHAATDDPVAQGVAMVLKQFLDILGTFGVLGFTSVGQPFDPERHEAVGQAPGGDMSPGTVLEELEKGYTLHDRLLRPAKVIVASAAE